MLCTHEPDTECYPRTYMAYMHDVLEIPNQVKVESSITLTVAVCSILVALYKMFVCCASIHLCEL